MNPHVRSHPSDEALNRALDRQDKIVAGETPDPTLDSPFQPTRQRRRQAERQEQRRREKAKTG